MQRWDFERMRMLAEQLFAKLHKRKRFSNPNHDIHHLARNSAWGQKIASRRNKKLINYRSDQIRIFATPGFIVKNLYVCRFMLEHFVKLVNRFAY
jgi:hypothetical protein